MDCTIKSSLLALPSAVASTVVFALALGCTPSPDPVGTGDSSGDGSSTGPGSTVTMTMGMTTVGMTTADTTADTTAGPATETGESTGSTGSTGSSGSTGDTTGDTTDGTTSGSSESSGSTSDASSGSTSDASSGSTSDASSSGSTSDASSGSTSDASSGSTSDASSGSSGGGMPLPDISGEFLLAMATPIDPTLPFQWVATFDFTAGGMGGGTVDVELQPLALDQGSSTTPRTFFGPPIVFPAVPVADDGSFTIDVGPLAVPAETNPIIFVDAQADMIMFDAQIVDADNLCGTVDGNLVMPIFQSLAGSTFGAVRVVDTSPAGLPVVFPISC